MKSASSFLLASRHCEITELEQLARHCELVGAVGRLVHAVQRERGISSIYLGSGGKRFHVQQRDQLVESDAAQQALLRYLERVESEPGPRWNGSRLFSRIALVLHALDGLPPLRARIAALAVPAPEATTFFGTLVAALLAVVFEAADAAGHPDISRVLVALFHLMQGKELAGQERALGARAFAAGTLDADGRRQWRHLVESQQVCLQVQADFADMRLATDADDPRLQADLARLRHLGCEESGGKLDCGLSDIWYVVCTRRIDAMRAQEERLTLHLRGLCERRIAQARAELDDQRAVLDRLLAQAQPVGPDQPAALGPHLERAVLQMVQEQSRRLQAMGDELESVRSRLTERKLIERAKGLLMAHHRLAEDEAYRLLRQMAMNQNRRMADVAQTVLSLSEVLSPAPG